MNFKFLSKKEIEKIQEKLKEQFGISEIPNGLFLKTGKDKIRIFLGSLTEKEIEQIKKIAVIEGIGLYFAKEESYDTLQIRLSIEATQLLKNQIKKNIFQLNDKETENWMAGRELGIKTEKKGFLIIKNKNTGDFLGTGKSSQNKIGNFIPKERRLKKEEID